MTEPVVPRARHRHDRSFGNLSPDVGAEVAVRCLPHSLVILESEAGVQNAGNRHEGGEDRGGQVEEFHAAATHLREQVGIGAQLVGGEQLDVQPAAGRLADAVERFLGAS